MHQALISWLDRTWASHAQDAASGRNTPTCAISRWAIVRTRATCCGSTSNRFFALAWARMVAYCWLASCCKSWEDTRLDMYCARSTPTVPPCVVCTFAQPASMASDSTPAPSSGSSPRRP